MSNRLQDELSPYLIQHAGNPVHWQPWDDQALQQAREQNKPIFLSIGYAACHWCHVMERESFEDPRIAEMLNDWFISIKVDREERPDLDNIYMDAVVAMTGQGGWPLSVFLTPHGQPFFGGTYFPPAPRHGLPSFADVLRNIHALWESRQEQIISVAANVLDHLAGQSLPQMPDTPEEPIQQVQSAARALLASYDWKHGGWGAAPKFPQPMLVDFLLHQASRGHADSLQACVHALQAMSQGGMYDLAGGGFHRYSTDSRWLVPHFEKMLYDNASLARTYLRAFLLTKDLWFSEVSTRTLDFIAAELMHPDGGFYSSLDADSEGVEGKYYLWSYDELQQVLSVDFDLVKEFLQLSPAGNFEGNIILRKKHTPLDRRNAAEDLHTERALRQALDRLASRRAERIRPALDDKVILAWNAQALQAFAEAAFHLDHQPYLQIAQANAHFLLEKMAQGDQIYRVWRQGVQGSPAFLEDYAALILGLLALHRADPQPQWLMKAFEIAETMMERFYTGSGQFFDTDTTHQGLIYRPRDTADNATPSGSSQAALALLMLDQISTNAIWNQAASQAIHGMAESLHKYPTAYGYWLQALDFLTGPVMQIAVLWPSGGDAAELYHSIRAAFLPRSVLVGSDTETVKHMLGAMQLLQNRPLQNQQPTAYVCEGFTCRLPTSDPHQFRRQIQSAVDA